MQSIEYQGYGLDLAQLINQTNNETLKEFLQNIIDHSKDDRFYDAMLNGMTSYVYSVEPTNTESFTFLFYMPSILPVITPNQRPMRQLTPDEANNELFNAIKTANQLIDNPQTLSNNDQTELLELVRQIADFSYNYDWTDLV